MGEIINIDEALKRLNEYFDTHTDEEIYTDLIAAGWDGVTTSSTEIDDNGVINVKKID